MPRIILLFTLALGFGGCRFGAEAPTLRVMTYNIAAGHGDLQAVARAVRADQPDVVALQEVDVHWGERSGFADQARELAEELGMHFFFAPIYTLPAARTDTISAAGPDAAARSFGLAILSRHPIARQENHLLTRLSTQASETTPRRMPGLAEAVVEIRGRHIRIFNTHLDYRRDPAVRSRQVDEMLAVIGGGDEPALLLGDLNARPGAAELAPLFDRFEDAWRSGEGEGFTYPATAPDRRIDYILHSDHFTVDRVWVPETQASDHRPVVTELRWNRSS